MRLLPQRLGLVVAAGFAVLGLWLIGESPAGDISTAAEVPLDTQDFLMLGPIEPTRLRIRIEVDGQPFRKAWLDTFDRLFAQFDNDHDGKLTNEQASRVAYLFGANLAGKRFAASVAQKEPAMSEQSTVSRDEFRDMLEQAAPPLKLTQKLSSGGAGPALVPLLDADGDGRLSRHELEDAAGALHCRDFNDDQLITEQELVAGPVIAESNSPAEVSAGDGSVFMLTRNVDAAAVAEILLSRYDRNRDGQLSLKAPAEIQSEAGGLSALDFDGDQLLTRTELRGYLDLPHDAELPFTLGGDGRKQKGTAADRFRLRGKLDGGFRLQVGSREINFRRKNRNPNQDENRLRMRDFDTDSNGSLDMAEFAGIQDRPDFASIDTNRDEKITALEFDSFFSLRSRAAAVQILLDASEEGSDLFRSLDKNSDHVLTPRELLMASQLLEFDDQDNDGYLGGAEMSYNLVLELSRGTPRTINANQALRAPRDPIVRADRSGPAWFLKMDRNRDGDVGLAEFPGNRRAFESLDVDRDGLISSDEASKFPTSSR